MGPFSVFDFRHQFWLYPTGYPAQGLNFAEEWFFVGLELLQSLPHFSQGFVIEAASGLAYVNQALLLVIESEHQRAEVGAAAFGFGKACRRRIRCVPDFDFQPFAAAVFFVATGAAFGDDAFESLLLRAISKRALPCSS